MSIEAYERDIRVPIQEDLERIGHDGRVDDVRLETSATFRRPLNNAPGAVVNLMNPANVETVFIAGKVRKWRGNLVGVDQSRIVRLAEEARDAVIRRSGFAADLFG